jgi:alcohol dehydrogenase, propanol-preferring
MNAYRFFTPREIEEKPLRLVDLPIPVPGAGQVLVKVLACGVCRTDLHTVEGEIHPPRLPLTLGHQVVGIIEKRGDDANTPKGVGVGSRVGIPWLYSACGQCDFCKRGQENLCSKARFTGFHTDGGYADYILADSRYVLPIPNSLSNHQAAPLLCAGIVGYRALKKADIQHGEHVGLFGFGASAHLCIQVLHSWGCAVSVFTRSLGHQDHARDLGAVWSGVAGQNPGKWLDRAVIFAPAGALAVRALELVRPGGTVAINAIHMSDIPSFPYQSIYGERTLRSVANATYDDGVEFLKLAEKIKIKSTLSAYPLSAANQALADIKHSRINGEAVLAIDT